MQLARQVKLLENLGDIDKKLLDECATLSLGDFMLNGANVTDMVQECLDSLTNQVFHQVENAKKSLETTKNVAKIVIVRAKRCLLRTHGHVHNEFPLSYHFTESETRDCVEKVNVLLFHL